MSPHQKIALGAMASRYWGEDDWRALNFRAFGREIPQHNVRRTVRSLARMGLAQFERGLWDDDGHPAGAGYRSTAAGAALAKEMGLIQ